MDTYHCRVNVLSYLRANGRSTIQDIYNSGRVKVQSGPSLFNMPADLIREAVKELVRDGEVEEAGRAGRLKAYRSKRYDCDASCPDRSDERKLWLPHGFLYHRFPGKEYVSIETPYWRRDGTRLTFSFCNDVCDEVQTAVVFSYFSKQQRETWVRRATEAGFVFRYSTDSVVFGWLSAPFKRLADVASWVASNNP